MMSRGTVAFSRPRPGTTQSPAPVRRGSAISTTEDGDDDTDSIFNSPDKLDITEEEKREREELERGDASPKPRRGLENGTKNKNGSVLFNGCWITAYEYTSELAKERNCNWERELDIANGLHTIAKDKSPEPEQQSLPPNFVLPPPRVSIPRKAKTDAVNTYTFPGTGPDSSARGG